MEDLESGEILLDGERVLGPAYNLIPGHEDMKLVSQEFYVLDNHTVEENIFDKLIGYANEEKGKRASALLKLLELTPLKNIRAKHLSSGQKQRVAIARALAIIPKVLLLDEPFSNLDKLLTEKLFAFITKEVKRNRTAVILITHLADEALKYADSLLVLDNGRAVEQGEKWQLYYEPKNRRLAGLLGDYSLLKKEDLFRSSRIKLKSDNNRTKLFLRPDRIKLSSQRSNSDLELKITNCSFNGKCFEVLGETKTGHSVMVYSAKKLDIDRTYPFTVELK